MKLTVRFNVVDREQASVIWDAVKSNTPVHGLVPRALAWGDMFREADMWERRYKIAKDLLDKEGAFEALEKLDRLERLFPIEDKFFSHRPALVLGALPEEK